MFNLPQKNKLVNCSVILVLALAFGLMIYSSHRESAIMDELAHIPAGYSYMKLADYRLNSEHPPLLKDLSAIPLLFMDLKFPKDDPAFQKLINGQWIMGSKFLYESGNDADKIIFWARFLPILLTLCLGLFIFKWAKELLGKGWGFLVLVLFILNPTVLAHGHYVTTDIPAAAGFTIGIYYFLKFLRQPLCKNVIFAGIAFGLAQLLKFSTVLLIPYFVIVFIAYLFKKYRSLKRNGLILPFSLTNYIAGFIFIFIIGLLIIYIPYFHHVYNYPMEKQLGDANFLLSSFAGGPDPEITTCKQWVGLGRQIRCLANIDIWMTTNSVLRPYAQYLLGVLMVMQRSSGGNTTYFLGEVSAGGWWYYFPVVFILKEPLASLILIAVAIALYAISKIKKLRRKEFREEISQEDKSFNFELGAFMFFVLFYWAYSMKSPLNIGIRHVLPTFPFIYILTVNQIKKWMASFGAESNVFSAIFSLIKQKLFSALKIILIAILMVWFVAETLFVNPHFISYFNELAGGAYNGYKYVVDSNLDWGQDLKELKKWVEKNNIEKINGYYFGGGSPTYYLGDKWQWWWPQNGKPQGWFALSATFLQGAKGKAAPGFVRKSEEEYPWLDGYDPISRAGTSIFIYYLP